MRHQWYGDNRDVIKWGVLITLCQRFGLDRILQVAMLTRDAEREKLRCNGFPDCDIPDEVWRHFRQVNDIKRLGNSCGIHIDVFDQEFEHASRRAYFARLLLTIQQQDKPLIVFLDPDTGIEPSKLKKEHVSFEEIRSTWQAVKPSGCLVLYQHARREKDWKASCLKKFTEACAERFAYTFDSQIANNVVFFAARKN